MPYKTINDQAPFSSDRSRASVRGAGLTAKARHSLTGRAALRSILRFPGGRDRIRKERDRRFESVRGLSKDLHITAFSFSEPAHGRGAEAARAASDDRRSVGEVHENCFMPQ